MSKIFEALQQAQAERIVREEQKADDDTMELVPAPATVCTVRPLGLEREMLQLAYAIESRLRHQNVVQFMGSQDGEGTATIAREFAWTMARQSGRPVLLVDASPMQLEHHRAYALKPGLSLDVALRDNDIEDSLRQVPSSNVYLAVLSKGILLPKEEAASSRRDPWALVRNRFSFILVSSPPIHHSTTGLHLCSRVDGVVLVVEAESTPAPVVRKVRDHIVNARGNLLGVVFNKQRYHIPDWIYARL